MGRLDKVGQRITGDRTQRARSAGGNFVFVAVDDHSRQAFTQVYPRTGDPPHDGQPDADEWPS